MENNNRPIVLIHGLWNTSAIFKYLIEQLNKYKIDYFAPTLKHDFGKISIVSLTKSLDELILKKYGSFKEIDVLGFSMGGIIGRYWIKKFNGYKRTNKFISVGSPHNGTLLAQLVPSYPFKGISEMKINSKLLNDLSNFNYRLENINCTSFYTYWDLMVIPGWKAHLPIGKKKSIKIYKHRNLLRNSKAVKKLIYEIIN